MGDRIRSADADGRRELFAPACDTYVLVGLSAGGCGSALVRTSMAARELPFFRSNVKRIIGISGPLAPREGGAGGAGAAHRLSCRSPRERRRSAAKTARPDRTSSAVVEALLRRWEWQPIEPATRRDPTEDDLRWLEEEVGAPLPSDYRRFLGSYGWTGVARALQFPLREAGPFGAEGEVSSFLGFSSEIRRDLAYLVSEVFAGTLPEGTVPIASDTQENLLLLSVAGTDRDRVWFWDRECRGLDDEIDEMVVDLEAEGEDTRDLDENEILRTWEALFPERRIRPPGFANVYAVADSFETFVASLR
jgi:hypothetical protein